MIATILEIVKPQLVNLHWIDRYAGLAKTIKRGVVVDTGLGYNEPTTEAFPAALEVNLKECWENGTYLDLVPNDRFKSVAYWEDISGLFETNQVRLSGGRSLVGYEGSLRLVFWLNMKKLGLESSDQVSPLVMDAVKALDYSRTNITDPIKIKRLGMRVAGITAKDHEIIFSRYSYSQDASLFMYPFDYFALDVKVQIQISNDCLPVQCPKFEIVC